MRIFIIPVVIDATMLCLVRRITALIDDPVPEFLCFFIVPNRSPLLSLTVLSAWSVLYNLSLQKSRGFGEKSASLNRMEYEQIYRGFMAVWAWQVFADMFGMWTLKIQMIDTKIA